MRPLEKRIAYAVAVLGCGVVLSLRMAVSDVLGGRSQLMPFILPIVAAAWWGGLGPGVAATLLGGLVAYFFVVPPFASLRIDNWADGLSLAIFLFLGLTISFLCDALHRARQSEVEAQFHVLADSIAQLVWIAGPDGEPFWFNRRCSDYMGAEPEELKEGGWRRFFDPTDLPRVWKNWQAAVHAGEPWEETCVVRRSDGQMRWHLVRSVPVRDKSGRITRWFGTDTDIHDRIAAEQALKEADARKDRYLAMLAHELRNPLSAISSAVQLWRRVPHDATELENLRELMWRHLQQLIRLIDDLMDLSRVSSGKIILRRAPLDLATAVERAIETVRPVIDAAGHKLTVTASRDPAYVFGDKARLTQIFVNLLQNAAKYTPHGGTISLVTEKCGRDVVVRVRDNGVGIPSHLLTAIFDDFYQVEDAVGCSQGGLGVGLTLCKQLVELHGGSIEARSDGAGKGSEFVVTFCAWATPSSNDALPPPRGDAQAVQCRILVVDDLRDVADNLARLLRSLGHEATPLYDGQSVLEWVTAHRPDIVLLDIGMPDMDGYEVARRLRQDRNLDAITLAALTGFGQRDDRRRAAEAGFDFHITKPPDIDDLQDLLFKVRDERQSVTDAAVACTSEDIIFTDEASPS